MERCNWCLKSNIETDYHDKEWGVPVHNDKKLFEFIILDSFQAGLSWKTILDKRENFRKVYDDFIPEIVANYDNNKISQLLNDVGIIRNKLKIQASISNARSFLSVQEKYGSFDKYIWQFSSGKAIINNWENPSQIPTHSKESDEMSKSLKNYGFKFVGTTICYAFMQAAGMINDHTTNCFRHKELCNI